MRFIRLDRVGHWRGQNHRSSWGGLGDEFPHLFEKGVSCYVFDSPHALESLRRYWFQTAMIDADTLSHFQITVFEGKKLDAMGSDWEDLAIPTATLKEIPAKEIMLTVQDLWEACYCGEITEAEYFSRLREIFENLCPDTKGSPLDQSEKIS